MATYSRTSSRKTAPRTTTFLSPERRQEGVSSVPERHNETDRSPWKAYFERQGRDPVRGARRMVALFALTMIVFSAFPVCNNLRGGKNKDYNLWYWTGQTALQRGVIYP